jgi:branched-chain amino acid transport system ATP-binding protein
LTAGYGQQTVVHRFDFELCAGDIVAVLGPNGAGKTTLVRTLAGLRAPLTGSIDFRDKRVTTKHPERSARRGLVLVPDSRELITALTTRENLVLANRRGPSALDEVLDLFPSLARRLDVVAGTLSGGEQQMLAMARGLVQRPHVMLVDEMTVGLAPKICTELAAVIVKASKAYSMATVLVEQHVDLALSIADRVLVMVHGQVRLDSSPKDLENDRGRLEEIYLAG